MLKLLGFLAKTAVFSLLVLALGSWVRWDGRTISDRMKTQINQAERSNAADEIRAWTHHLGRRAQDTLRDGFGRAVPRRWRSSRAASPAYTDRIETRASAENTAPPPSEQIAPTERQKLRALIRDLNPAPAETGLRPATRNYKEGL
jgi:hypothetical protein